jgi:WD40 repeat protein
MERKTLSDGQYIFKFLPTPIIDTSAQELQSRSLLAHSPYQGLQSFEIKDREYFWGRDELIFLLLSELCERNLILLLGSSGSGKTSVIQAGLISRFQENLETKFTEIIFYPDRNPFLSLFNGFVQKNYNRQEAEVLLQEDVDSLTEFAKLLQAKDEGSYWLIFIDRFEEMFAISDPKKSHQFIESLCNLYEHLNNSPNYPVKLKIIMAMRTDFLEKLYAYSRLVNIIFNQKNVRAIAELKAENLRLVIEQTAARHGVLLEKELVKVLIQDIREQKNCLPILQYALTLLWHNEDIDNRILKLSTYQQIGGIKAAFQQQLERIYENFNHTEKLALKKVFLKLTKLLNRERLAISQRVKLDDFKDECSQKVVNRLIEEKLLVIKDDRVILANEILLEKWDIFKNWLEEAWYAIALRKQLAEAVKSWKALVQENKNKANLKLWTDEKLEKVCELRDNHQFFELIVDSFTTDELQFLDASLAWQSRLLKSKETQIQQLSRSLNEATLREQAARVQNILPIRPLEGLLLAIQTIGANLDKLPQQVLPAVQTSLNCAMEIAKEKNILLEHEDRVNTVEIGSDGQIIVSGSWDKTLRLWDLQGNPIGQPFWGHEGEITAVAFSPDGKTIASSGGDGTIRLWNPQGNSLQRPFFGHDGDVTAIAFSPDGLKVASSGVDGTVRLWGLQGNLIGEPFRGHEGDVTTVAFSPDGQTIASGGGDGTIRLWNLQGHLVSEPFQGHDDKVTVVTFSPDGQKIASGSWDATVRIWDLQGKALARPFRGHQDYILAIAFDSKGKLIASGSSDKTIRLWDLQGHLIGQPLRGHKSSIRSVTFSPDGQTLISGSTDKTLRLWDLQGNAIAQPIQGHDVSVWSVAVSPIPPSPRKTNSEASSSLPLRKEEGEGGIIASGGGDGTVRLWDLSGNSIGHPFRGHNGEVTAVAFSPDGKKIASGSWDRTIRLWDLDGNCIAKPFQGHEKDVTAVAFSPDGKKIASGSWDKTIRLWDLQGNPILQPFLGHEEDVTAVAFSPDGQVIASGSWDKTIRLWDIDGKPIAQPFRGHQERVDAIAFSPDGRILVSGGGDGTVRLWDLYGNPIAPPFQGHESYIATVAFSPDGQRVVSGGGDGTVRLWDLYGNAIAPPFEISQSEVTSVAFSPDGKMLVGGSLNGKIYLWRGGGWLSWLKVCCDRLRYHPAFKKPQTEMEKLACTVCQKQIWNLEVIEWNKQGIAQLEKQAFPAALENFDRVLHINPYHTGARYNRARTYLNLGNPQKAIEDFDRLIEAMPTHAAAYFYRGQCYAQLGNRPSASEDCQQAIDLYEQQGQDANAEKAIAFLHQL